MAFQSFFHTLLQLILIITNQILNMVLVHCRGTYRFQDVMNCGTKSQMETIYKIQHKIQFDEPANIQFTSVRPLF